MIIIGSRAKCESLIFMESSAWLDEFWHSNARSMPHYTRPGMHEIQLRKGSRLISLAPICQCYFVWYARYTIGAIISYIISFNINFHNANPVAIN